MHSIPVGKCRCGPGCRGAGLAGEEFLDWRDDWFQLWCFGWWIQFVESSEGPSELLRCGAVAQWLQSSQSSRSMTKRIVDDINDGH